MQRWILLCILSCWAGGLSALHPIYRLKGHPYQYYLETQEVKAPSRTTCGLSCNAKDCGYFSFQDGICKIHDPGTASPPTSGQYRSYYLYDPSIQPDILTDVAFGKSTLPTVHHAYLTSSRAVDGSTNTQYHSLDMNNPWWSVNLGGMYIIRNIDVLPHTGVPFYFKMIKVFVGSTEVTNGDFSSYTEVADYPGPWSGSERVVFTPPTLTAGRYVAIKIVSTCCYLNILDVKVMV